MSEYTKGSWEPFFNDRFWEVNAPSPEAPDEPVQSYSPSVAYVWQVGGPETQEANAHLIAAAPELLEALKDVMAGTYIAHQHKDCADCNFKRALLAITKAEGRSE